MVIYKLTNNINGKIYIGQAKDFAQRMRNHKSTAFNSKCHEYSYHLYYAIRKYGWDNFNKEIIEDIPEEESQDYVNDRERFWISYYDSNNRDKGYNREKGGTKGNKKEKYTLEQKINLSKIFNLDEIKDIHSLLLKGTPIKDIREKYYPKLSESMLNNINLGLNFKDENLKYPLHDYVHDGHSLLFTQQEQKLIQQDLIENKLTYKQIAEKWKIVSLGLLSLINNGAIWYDKELIYPLSIRGCSRLHNFQTWVKPVQDELMNGNLSMIEIAKKYNKSKSTIYKINNGSSYKNEDYHYPLISNRKNY